MKLLTFNANQAFVESMKGVALKDKTYPQGDALYIAYLPIWMDEKTFLLQIDIIKTYLKRKIPIIIFDQYLALKPDEYEWLRKFKDVRFFEPALDYRPGFRYLPSFCEKVKKMGDLKLTDDIERPVSLGYKGAIFDRIKSFEKYYIGFGQNYPEHPVCYDNNVEVAASKLEKYDNLNVKMSAFGWDNMKATVLMGSNRDYKIGYIRPEMFTALENNVIIMLPEEHRYYYGLFPETVVSDPQDIEYLVRVYDLTYLGFVLDVYDRIERFYPEFIMNHHIDVVKREVEK